MWRHLTIYTELSAPYYYPVESLLYKEGLLFQIINDWCNRGIDVEITIKASYRKTV